MVEQQQSNATKSNYREKRAQVKRPNRNTLSPNQLNQTHPPPILHKVVSLTMLILFEKNSLALLTPKIKPLPFKKFSSSSTRISPLFTNNQGQLMALKRDPELSFQTFTIVYDGGDVRVEPEHAIYVTESILLIKYKSYSEFNSYRELLWGVFTLESASDYRIRPIFGNLGNGGDRGIKKALGGDYGVRIVEFNTTQDKIGILIGSGITVYRFDHKKTIFEPCIVSGLKDVEPMLEKYGERHRIVPIKRRLPTDFIDAFLLEVEGNQRTMVFVERFNSFSIISEHSKIGMLPVEVKSFQLTNLVIKSSLLTFTDQDWHFKAKIEFFPMKYDPNIRWTKVFNSLFLYVLDFNAGVRSVKNNQFEMKADVDLKSSGHIQTIGGVPKTNFFVVLTNSIILTETRTWNPVKDLARIHLFAMNSLETDKLAEYALESKLVVPIKKLPLGDYIILDEEGNLAVMSQWAGYVNLVDFGPVFDIGCPEYKVRVIDFLGVNRCESSFTTEKYCRKAQGISKSCYQCERAQDKDIYLVDSPTFEYPFKRVCVDGNIDCEHPFYMDQTLDACYDCRKITGCDKCFHQSKGCFSCLEGFALYHQQLNCYKCSVLDERCLECEESQKKLGEFKCTKCSSGYFYTDSGGSGCKPCPENCDKCLDTKECQVCKQGYLKKVDQDGANFCMDVGCSENEY